MPRDRPDPEDLSIWRACERYLRNRRVDATEASVKSWEYRLKLFAEWVESVGITSVGELQRYDLVEYYELRAGDVAPSTLEGEMWTLKGFMEFLEDLGAVEDLAGAVRIPDVDEADRTSDERLETEAAMALLRHYRSKSPGTRSHVFLELAWITGARLGGLRGLDLRDVETDQNPYVEFRHRPETRTPLKNKYAGERSVAIPAETGAAIQAYIDRDRYDVDDDNGRRPLLASARGRPGKNTVRVWSYLATEPCIHSACPHGRDRETCKWVEYAHASKCPSSRSPHPIRSGAITWMLNLGWPIVDISDRVNSDPKTIRRHYDTATLDERRRRQRDAMQDRRHLVDAVDLSNT